ncbi:MAG: MFS transporter [Candidatus Hodarchaeales archaeon]|jgi:MFS family permease
MLRRLLSKYTKDTLLFFGQPITFFLREQIRLLLLAVAVTEAAFSSSVICLPLYFFELPERTGGLFPSEFELPILLTVYYLVSLTTASFFGSVSDRIGRKPLLVTGTFLAALTFIPFPIIFAGYANSGSSFLILLGASALKGLASAMLSGPVLSMFADLAPERSHGETMGKFYLARSGGGASGFLIGGLTWDLFKESSFYVFTFILLLATSLYLFRFYEPKSVKIELEDVNGDDVLKFEDLSEPEDPGLNPFKAMLQSLKNKQFRKFAFAWLAYTTLVGAGGTYAPVILKEVTAGGVGATTIGFVALVGVGIMGILQPTLGKLSDNFGRKPFLIIGCVGTSLLLVIFAAILRLEPESFINLLNNPFTLGISKKLEFAPGIILPIPHVIIILLLLICLICASGFGSSSLALITDVTKEGNRGREMGFTSALMSTGSILGTVVGGTLFEYWGSLGVMTFCLGLSLIAVVIIVQFLYETSGFYHFTHKLM